MRVLEHSCPECGANKNEPCKAPPPLPMTGVHNKRWDQLQFKRAVPRITPDAKSKK